MTDNPESETVGFQSADDPFAWYTVAEIAKIAFREGYEAALDDLR